MQLPSTIDDKWLATILVTKLDKTSPTPVGTSSASAASLSLIVCGKIQLATTATTDASNVLTR